MSPKEKSPSFEEALRNLEDLIDAMERGETPLADLVARFEEGSKLLKLCHTQLKEAELKIEKLNLKTGEPEPFEDSDD